MTGAWRQHCAEKSAPEQLIKLRPSLPPLVGDLRETTGLERITAAALDAVTAGVRANRAAMLVVATWVRGGAEARRSSGMKKLGGCDGRHTASCK